ncbi:NYN domain-containing protein [Rhizobium leguminosarum]
MVTRYLFLDGGCLRARLNDISHRYCEGAPLKINWWSVSAGYEKIFYYDALPARKPSQSDEDFEAERQEVEHLHATLATFDRFRVNEGDTRYRKGRGLEQKKVDVMIAVDMMIHTIRRNMTTAGLLAGDADFTPLLNALSNEGMFVTLIHPPKASKDLLAAADARRAITAKQVYDWLDTPSQARFGSFPVPSYGDTSHDGNCQHIWSDDLLGIEVWYHLIDETIWASWPAPELNDRLSLRGGNWKHTRLVALDDYGVDLPTDLLEEFGHL